MLDIHKGNVLNKPILGLVDSQDSLRRGTSNRPDDQYRLKLVERVSRLQNDVAIRRMDFDEARKRLEADEESLRIAQEALRLCDSDATEAVIRSTKRMSIDPDILVSPGKGKGKAKEKSSGW